MNVKNKLKTVEITKNKKKNPELHHCHRDKVLI